MTIRDLNLFSEFGARLQMDESIELTIQSMQAYGQAHDHWVIAWSGGKDSTATLTLIVWMITAGKIPAPKRITVLYADTRMELPPLAIAAMQIMDELVERGIECRISGGRGTAIRTECIWINQACQRARPAVQLAMDLARA